MTEIRSEQLERASDKYTGLQSIKRLYLVLAFSFAASTMVVTFDVGLVTLASTSSFLPGILTFTITERSVLKLIATKTTQGQVFEK